MRKVPLLLLSSLAIGCGLLAVKDALAKYEEPAFEVVYRDGPIEIRLYPPLLAAQVTLSGIDESAANQAFSILASYIFGKNEGKTKIEMTTPVTEHFTPEKIAMTVPVVEQFESDKMTMRFYMPSKYRLETLPVPKDKRIEFVETEEAKIAVIRFSGVADERNFRKHADRLLSNLQKSRYKTCGEPIRAFYNPPWTLPPLRRNEIWIPVI